MVSVEVSPLKRKTVEKRELLRWKTYNTCIKYIIVKIKFLEQRLKQPNSKGKTVLKYLGFNFKNPVTLNLINVIIKFKFARRIKKNLLHCSQRS